MNQVITWKVTTFREQYEKNTDNNKPLISNSWVQ